MNKNIINILIAVYREYGYNAFISRIKRVLGIEIPSQNNLKIEFLIDQIVFKEPKSDKSYIISFYDDHYKFIQEFSDYSVSTYYTYKKYKFEKLYSFKSSDNNRIVVNEIEDDTFTIRRIIKTSDQDINALQGDYEKEINEVKRFNAKSNYSFVNLNGNVNIKKDVRMPNCIYYYSYQSEKTIPEILNSYNILEVGATTNTPRINFSGRVRTNNEALETVLQTPQPNIIIRGAIIPNSDELKTFFKITIMKSKEGITIHYISSDTPAIDVRNKIIVAPVDKDGEFSLTELDNIITAIKQNLTSEFKIDFKRENIVPNIIAEVEKIKDSIIINQQKKLKKVDALDFKLQQYDDINHLAFDVYENLSNYERLINQALGKQEQPPSLTKKDSKQTTKI